MKKARELLPRCILLVFSLELFSWRGAFCQTSGQAGVIEGAKKEGKVVWYATLNISDSNALLHRFARGDSRCLHKCSRGPIMLGRIIV